MTSLPIPQSIPQSLVDVAETLGMSVALRLMQHFGGLEIYIPLSPPPDHPLIEALGQDDAIALCQFVGTGSILYIPKGVARTSSHRASVARLSDRGLTRQQIARELGISQRHVRRLANGPVPSPDQPDLFD